MAGAGEERVREPGRQTHTAFIPGRRKRLGRGQARKEDPEFSRFQPLKGPPRPLRIPMQVMQLAGGLGEGARGAARPGQPPPGLAPASGTVAGSELGGKGKGENMSIKGSSPAPPRILPALGPVRLLPQLPGWPGPHTGILPSHQQEGTESGDRLRLSNQCLLALGQSRSPQFTGHLLAIARAPLGSALRYPRARETEAQPDL